ncbi:MAG: hypothetical protein B7X93_09695 [Hydrogenophilales bacterium 17-61-9]|nr:MAG: hypothetical protein B7X93_09695 [Hydrogenophilales bacterium 17-61-9]
MQEQLRGAQVAWPELEGCGDLAWHRVLVEAGDVGAAAIFHLGDLHAPQVPPTQAGGRNVVDLGADLAGEGEALGSALRHLGNSLGRVVRVGAEAQRQRAGREIPQAGRPARIALQLHGQRRADAGLEQHRLVVRDRLQPFVGDVEPGDHVVAVRLVDRAGVDVDPNHLTRTVTSQVCA